MPWKTSCPTRASSNSSQRPRVSKTAQKHYWFETTPNINILITQAAGDIAANDLNAEILTLISDKTKQVTLFNVLVNPSEDVTEQLKPTLVILPPQYLATENGVVGKTTAFIEKLATQKGNSDRLYRNTMLFLVCSEIGINSLKVHLKNYLACQKISSEYQNQLSSSQKEDLRKRMEDANKTAEKALVEAYTIVAKAAFKTGIAVTVVKQFKDSLDTQINTHILNHLKEESWLLDTVGWGPLEKHNLLPIRVPQSLNRALKIWHPLQFLEKFP